MTNQHAREELFAMAEQGYKEFSSALTPGVDDMLGVRVPKVKALAKRIAAGDYKAFLQRPFTDYHEERLLYGFVLGFIKVGLNELLDYFAAWLECVDNWAVCDCAVMNLKAFGKSENKQRVWDFLCEKAACNDKPYYIRAAAVAMFGYFLDGVYDQRVAEFYQSVTNDHYYVRMGVAWGMSVLAVKNYGLALKVFQSKRLPAWTHNKGIQKSCESLRLTESQKAELKALKV